jgi:signal recognition particle subunit SRP54
VLQLQQLGERIGVTVHTGEEGERPPSICARAAQRARNEQFDAIIYDTAGRLAIDEDLMVELEEIERETSPANRILVCDSLMGRDAVNVAKAFSERMDLDGLVLTKLDGDARGGAALAVKAVTGVPIKFVGTGETLDRLEEFRPEGMASRILGMGDIVGLVKDFEEVADEKEAEADAAKLLKGQFGLDDLLKQLKMIQKMGPLREVLGKMPMFGQMADQVDEGEMVKVEALIRSMTPAERSDPDLIDKSRASRIARGSGRRSKDVRELVERFRQMRDMMASLGSAGGMLSRIPGMGRLAGAGGAGDLDPAALFGGMGSMAGGTKAKGTRKQKRQKGKRKQARKARKRNRRK